MVTHNHSRGKRLFGRTREAVLCLLLLRSDERFYLRQIVRLTGAGLGPIQRELADLVSMSILTRERSGNQVYFQARTDSPIFADLRQLMLKTSGIAGVLRESLEPFASRIQVAVVFGSAASGKLHAGSDVDLLVISDHLTIRQLGSAVRRAGTLLGRDVNINLYRSSEWKERVRAGHPLAKSILTQPRIMLMGSNHELGQLAEERMA